MESGSTVDVLAVGAHPDDVELGVGGLLHKLASRGFRTGILDLTRGELGTRGSAEIRAREAESAAQCLGAVLRRNAELPDGALANSSDHRVAVLRHIRDLRPRVLLAPMSPDRHPDHRAAHGLVRDANFLAGLTRIETGQDPHRAPNVYWYCAYHEPKEAPAFVADISGHFDAKRAALRAYASQFHNPDAPGPETYVSTAAFWENIEIRARYWGARVGVSHGEPLFADTPVLLDLLPGLPAAALD